MAYTKAQKARFEEKLHDVFNECIEEMNALEIPFGRITEVTVNYRAKSRWGQCQKRSDVYGIVYKININVDLLLSDDTLNGLKSTICHEILHTCPKCWCHTGEWKRLAKIVNDCYGYNVQRADTPDDKGFDEDYTQKKVTAKMTYKYEFECSKCGQKIRRKRECEFTKHYRNYTCGYCGGRFVPVGYAEVGFYGDMIANRK